MSSSFYVFPKLTGKERRIRGIIDNLIFLYGMDKEYINFINVILPTSILGDNNLTPLERLLLISILSLCKQKGYCWATNEYFAELFGVRKQTISKSISSLFKNNYVELKFDNSEKNNSKRIIKISEALTKIILGIKENMNTSINKNHNQYNRYNHKRKNIINEIYTRDEDGNEYWNGKKIESNEATQEEIEELENLLKEFRD